jgi:hypothetical protein
MNGIARSFYGRMIGMVLLVGCLATMPVLGNGLGQSTATKEFQKTLTLGADQTVSLTHKYGDVRIHAENGRDVRISATIRVQAHSQSEADRYAEQVRIDVSQDSQGIKIQTAYPSDDSKFFTIRVGGPSYSVDYDITVPTDAKLWMKNNFGNVEVQGVQGWTDLENSHGRLKFQDGGSTKLTDSFGEVHVTGADGNVTVTNNNGAVTVSISLKTSFAPMQVRLPADAGYAVNARTSFGHISSDLPVMASGTLGGDSLNGKIGNGGCTLSLTNSNGNIEILKLGK